MILLKILLAIIIWVALGLVIQLAARWVRDENLKDDVQSWFWSGALGPITGIIWFFAWLFDEKL